MKRNTTIYARQQGDAFNRDKRKLSTTPAREKQETQTQYIGGKGTIAIQESASKKFRDPRRKQPEKAGNRNPDNSDNNSIKTANNADESLNVVALPPTAGEPISIKPKRHLAKR